jgi:two-component sensor histidine kinase
VSVRDITRRKAAEDGLKAGLAEKEVLLREIHHRVKNNLQVVLSLLGMHSRKVKDPAALGVFTEARARIRAMGLVHEILCRSAGTASINMRDYAGTLTRDIISAYGRTQDVVYECQVCDRAVPADIAMQLGLILNELVSNSLKHAFAGGRSGRVLVTMSTEPGGCRLEVEDDGPGLPADLKDRAGNTLGLELVRTLAGQLSGTFEIPPGGAARFIVRFPI